MIIKGLTKLFEHRELLWNLTSREIKARYKQSFLGYFWVILNPFFQMLVMSFVFAFILRVSPPGIPYPIFLYVGLLPWLFFQNSLSSAVNSLVGNASLIRQIDLPREVFPLSTILAKIVDFFLASLILIGFFVYYRLPININALWFIPIFLIQIVLTTGLGFFISALNLFYRDIQYLLGLILTLWMYLTPIIYSVDIVPEKYRWIFKLNPMSVLINAYRQTIIGGGLPNFTSLSIGLAVSLLILFIGYKTFKRLEGLFADIV